MSPERSHAAFLICLAGLLTLARVCRIWVETVRRASRLSLCFCVHLVPAHLWFAPVFSYYNLYQSKSDNDLFIAASVFLAPMAFSSVVTMVSKARLMRRRIQQRRAVTRSRLDLATRAFTPAARRAALRMLMERFLLQHDQLVFDERKAANDAHRYEGYGHMLGVLGEVPTLLARCCGSAAPMSIARFVLLVAGYAVRSDQRTLCDAAGISWRPDQSWVVHDTAPARDSVDERGHAGLQGDAPQGFPRRVARARATPSRETPTCGALQSSERHWARKLGFRLGLEPPRRHCD